MSLIIMMLTLAFIGASAASWCLYLVDKECGKVADGVQAFATVVALLLGGYWYFVDRKGQHRKQLDGDDERHDERHVERHDGGQCHGGWTGFSTGPDSNASNAPMQH